MNILASLTGLVVYAYYATAMCDPIEKGYIQNSNQVGFSTVLVWPLASDSAKMK